MIKLPSLIFTPLIAVAAAQISSPVISEFMASNRGTLALGDESSPDWIEIHNSSERDLDLEGWHLTDDPNDPTKWLSTNQSFALSSELSGTDPNKLNNELLGSPE